MTTTLHTVALLAKRSSHSLEVSCFPHPETRKYLLQELSENTRLESLVVSTVCQMADFSQFFPNLTKLDLKGFILTHFGFLNSPITFLSLVGCRLISEHLGKLSAIKSITFLILDQNKLTDRGQKGLSQALKNLPSLTSLSLAHVDFREGENMDEIVRSCSGLKEINLSGSQFNEDPNDVVLGLTRHSRLTRLFLADLDLQDVSLQYLADTLRSSTILTSLNISKNRFSMVGMAIFLRSLKKNSTLQDLNLSQNESSQKSNRKLFDAMREPIHLQKLDLRKTGLLCKEAWEKFVQQNPSLQLDVTSPPLPQGDRALSLYIRRSANTLTIECFLHNKARIALLEQLAVTTRITKLAITTFQEMDDFDLPFKELTFLTLKGFTLTHFSFTHLPLTYLSLIGCQLISEHLGKLCFITTLVILILDKNQLDEDGSHRLAVFLENTKTLEYLSLKQVDLSAGLPLRIIQALPPSLKTLRLDQLMLYKSSDRENLIPTLFKRSFLRKISLSGMNLNDERLEQMKSRLLKNSTLQSLNLSGNRLTLRGIQDFISLLKTNKSLIELDISMNGMGSQKKNNFIFESLNFPLTLQRFSLMEVGQSDPIIVQKFRETHPELHLEV